MRHDTAGKCAGVLDGKFTGRQACCFRCPCLLLGACCEFGWKPHLEVTLTFFLFELRNARFQLVLHAATSFARSLVCAVAEKNSKL